jgi:hypothetical protein
MRYTNRTIIASQSRVSHAEERVSQQRKVVESLHEDRHPADHAAALLLVMEQSLLSMKRYLSLLERDLERSLGPQEKSARRRVSRRRTKATRAAVAEQVVDALRSGGIDASVAETATDPAPKLAAETDRPPARKL